MRAVLRPARLHRPSRPRASWCDRLRPHLLAGIGRHHRRQGSSARCMFVDQLELLNTQVRAFNQHLARRWSTPTPTRPSSPASPASATVIAATMIGEMGEDRAVSPPPARCSPRPGSPRSPAPPGAPDRSDSATPRTNGCATPSTGGCPSPPAKTPGPTAIYDASPRRRTGPLPSLPRPRRPLDPHPLALPGPTTPPTTPPAAHHTDRRLAPLPIRTPRRSRTARRRADQSRPTPEARLTATSKVDSGSLHHPSDPQHLPATPPASTGTRCPGTSSRSTRPIPRPPRPPRSMRWKPSGAGSIRR